MLGEVIHGYRVDRALSEDKGGFGDVYFATHVESGAEAVVKVLKPEMSALRDIVARFFNEARAAASVHHPGIVQIHNVGYHGDRAYLLMERLRGDDLETRLAKGPLPVDRAVIFVRQAAGAVGAAHERGIVHRDLKPANLFVVADPDVIGGERVKVLDFGIAKLTADTGAGKTQGVFGTPAYMSPEQCASTGDVDPRADLYSLGCIFYELVTGRPPFGHGGLELIAAHLRDMPPPPRALAPWLPPAIEQVILGLLEKQPGRRTPSCAALIAALDAAALSSGIAGASLPAMPVAYDPAMRGPARSTLGGAAGAMSMPPPARRGLGLWLGLGGLAVVGGVAALVLATSGGHPAGNGPPPPGAGDAGVAVVAPADATAVAVAGRDAAAPVAATAPVADTAVDAGHESSQAEHAAKDDEAGAALMKSGNYAAAAERFRYAVARWPEAKYMLDLGFAQYQQGHYGEAIRSARAVAQLSPSSAVAARTRKLVSLIEKEARRQDLEIRDPEKTFDMPPGPDAVGVPPGAPLPHAAQPDAPPDAPPAPPAATGQERADKLNEEGKELMYSSKYEEALAKFREAYELTPVPKLLLNMCTAQYQLGRCADARRSCQNLIATWPVDPVFAKAQKLLEKICACNS